MSKLKAVKNSLLNGFTDAIQFNAGVTHLVLKYATDHVENREAYWMRVVHGVPEEDTIKNRQRLTCEKQMEISNKINNVKETKAIAPK